MLALPVVLVVAVGREAGGAGQLDSVDDDGG
jgi:hypothetical protein